MAANESDEGQIPGSVDLVMMDDESGAVVTITATRARRLTLDRVLVFLADGVTLWFNDDFDDTDHRPDVSWTRDGRAQRVRVSTRTTEDLEPAEHLAGDEERAPFRVPLTLDLTLEPVSQPVPAQRRFPDQGLRGSQVYRASGSLAAGSVVYRISGQAWVGRTGFASRSTEVGTRLQAAFQDGSAMLATAPQAPDEIGPAAFQEHTATVPLTASTLQVDGPARRIPMRLICQLDGDPGVTLTGGYRSLDQHLAFVTPSDDGRQWVRRAYTPFDFARSGVTGFGIVEQVERVGTPESPADVGTGIPETF